MELTPREIEMMDMALQYLRTYLRGSQRDVTDYLAREGKGSIRGRLRVVSLLFSYGLVMGGPPLFYVTERGMRAQRIGVAAWLREVRRKEMRNERMTRVTFYVVIITMFLTLLSVLL